MKMVKIYVKFSLNQQPSLPLTCGKYVLCMLPVLWHQQVVHASVHMSLLHGKASIGHILSEG